MDAFEYKRRQRTARTLLGFALIAAALAWFLPINRLHWGRFSGSTSALLHASILGLFPNIYPTYLEFLAAIYAVHLSIALTLVAAPFAVSLLSKALLLKWLWILVDFGWLIGLTIGWHRGREVYFISLTVEYNPDVNAQNFPGFYLACLAAILHFTGLLLIPSAKSLDRPTPPASE